MKEEIVKHLEFIENNISRMNQCSFKMKELMGVIIAAILAVYATTYSPELGGKSGLFIAATILTIMFWIIDGYYLYQEKLFRDLYKDVAGLNGKNNVKPFDMSTKKYKGGASGYFKTLFSISEWPIYLTALVLLVCGRCFM